jgi:archaellum component FlaF (FlaF/FlaG flagellin family)
MIKNLKSKQKGASAIVLIIVLAIFGFAVYVGLQYIPQRIESGTVDSILDSIVENHKNTPVQNVSEILSAINRQLSVNQMNDMKDNFRVSKYRGTYTIKVSYERELNLGYETKKIQYEKTRILE